MSIQTEEDDDGEVLAIYVRAKLSKEDYEELTPEFERMVKRHAKIRLLFDMADVHDWNADAAWESFKLSLKHSDHVGRVAVVGEAKWGHFITALRKLFTKADIRYFRHANGDAAWQWVNEI